MSKSINRKRLKWFARRSQSSDNNLGRFFGPSANFAGYVLIFAGIIALSYSLVSLVLIIPGAFMAFTYNGTILDFEQKRVKPYTSLFGIIRIGNWIEVKQFTGFSITKVTNKYSAYSRANVMFSMDISDIRLMLLNKDGKGKVVVDKFSKFEDARKKKDELRHLFFPEKV
jgi:hypothetical protein